RVKLDALVKEGRELLVTRSAAAEDAASTAKMVLIGGTVGAVVLMAGIAFFLTKGLTAGINQIGTAMKRIAVGDLGADVSVKSSDEIGEMADSYREMKVYLEGMSDATRKVGDGDLTVIVNPKGDDDVLGNALKRMIAGLRDVVGQVVRTATEVGTASEQLASAAEQAAVGDEQILVAQESTASREIIEQSSPNEPESIFIDTQPEDSEAPARAPELALNVAEELPAAEESEPADEENAGVVDEHSAVIEEIVPAIEPTSSAAEELSIATSTAGPDEIFTLSESTGHFYIIVASFLTEVRAREYAGSLSANEDTPTILSPLGDTSRYRVAIASYETMAELQANLPSYKSKYGDELWPLRYIVAGTTTMLSTGTGKFYVIVSSFSTEALARKHTDILAATGENPIIIPPFGPSRQYRVALFGYESLTAAQAALPQHRENYGSDAWLLRY
ncbi:MAG: HAMP domain-containing protein, partial [Proteobacteria bacterium]|nr:HAMP domain-containing protein [Pseudomonadota bacterium]